MGVSPKDQMMNQTAFRHRASVLLTAAVVAGLAGCVLAQPAPEASEAREAPLAPPAPPPPSTTPSVDAIERRIEAQAREMAAMQRSVEAKQRALQSRSPMGGAAGGGGGGELNPAGLEINPFARGPVMVLTAEGTLRTTVPPALIVTSQLSDSERNAWTEDLAVMDKLVREAVRSDGPGTVAMGIHINAVKIERDEPTYLEGAGVLLSARTEIALATSGAPTTAPAENREVESAWERARRELKGPIDRPKSKQTPALPVFEQAKLDRLIESLLTLLPEATNIRELPENEFVYITVTGTDDTGTPRRLNLKAGKSDIDQAASGEISPETFRQRVASNID